jgi:four helix bundle protein
MLSKFLAYQIAKDIYRCCKPLRMRPFLYEQLIRSSSSIALNIAEGSGKRTEKNQGRFYSIALGSLRETQAILELEEIADKELLKKVDHLGAILFKLSEMNKAHERKQQQQQKQKLEN